MQRPIKAQSGKHTFAQSTSPIRLSKPHHYAHYCAVGLHSWVRQGYDFAFVGFVFLCCCFALLKRSYLMFPKTVNVPPQGPRRRKIHDNSMYHFACRCTNEIIHANSMCAFEIASNTMHTEELAAAKPPPTLLYASTLMQFRKNTCY